MWVGITMPVLKRSQAGYASVDERFEILLRSCLRTWWRSIVGVIQGEVMEVIRRPECEDVFCALRELVELEHSSGQLLNISGCDLASLPPSESLKAHEAWSSGFILVLEAHARELSYLGP